MTDYKSNRRWLVVERPTGMPEDTCFKLVEEPVPQINDGEYLVRNQYLSFDPSMRTWMNDGPNYLPPIQLGEVMRSVTLGKVVSSKTDACRVGDLVMGMHGWEDFSRVAAGGFAQVVPAIDGVSPTAFLGALGPTGLTAYFGILDIGAVSAGNTVLVSGAAGAVGSVAGQIARLKGCRVVGLAGTAEKCDWITRECGFDAAINYRQEADLSAAIAKVCPEGIDVFFDNVGGEQLDAALNHINKGARIVACGSIAGYNDAIPSPPVRNLWMLIIREAELRGFLVSSFMARFESALIEMASWVLEGKLHFREDRVEGLDQAPEALRRVLRGENLGKMLLDV